MTLPSRIMVKLSLAYLLMGASMGVMLLLNKAFNFYAPLWAVLPVHIEFMLIGWVVQLTLGVAYWILPRYFGKQGRGNPILAYAMIGVLNTGIIVVSLSQLDVLPSAGSWMGRCLEMGGVILFVFLHWKRIVTYNK
ncbi:MAG: cbb3-type cytochrome c oxidase subunit I [Balneolaceae bacterium]|nr:cbb3-type cytochrome c oxidase subunit I [Balneolaceae bacterium]